jgi:lipoyltransferase/lipoate-protein ligase
MFLIDNNNITDPYLNLALEEYCLRNRDAGFDYLLFYVNEPSIVVGKHQNLFQEFNFEFTQDNHILLVRRISGGGAVYHDDGNLNFSFITGFHREKLDYFKKLIQPWRSSNQKEFNPSKARSPILLNIYLIRWIWQPFAKSQSKVYPMSLEN